MGKEITGDLRSRQRQFLGHWDIPPGSDLILTIDHVEEGEAFNSRSKRNDEVEVLIFKETKKPMIINRTNNALISKALGSWRVETWKGKKISLYEAVEPRSEDGYAIRVREYPPKSDEIICADCGIPISNHGKLTAKVIAERAVTRFGVPLCYNCGADRAALEDEGNNENNAE